VQATLEAFAKQHRLRCLFGLLILTRIREEDLLAEDLISLAIEAKVEANGKS